jgi:hypothetical protein
MPYYLYQSNAPMLTAQDYLKSSTHESILMEQAVDPYANSAFQQFKSLSSKKKGKFFELLYEEYMTDKGCKVEKPNNSNHDRICNSRKKEIKGSFLWGTGTHFRWQQIRPGQDYDDMVFVCVFPDRVEFYEADKQTVTAAVEVQDEKGNWIYNQHGGKTVNSGTFCLDGFPKDFSWMKEV